MQTTLRAAAAAALVFLCLAPPASAVEVTIQGSGALSWLDDTPAELDAEFPLGASFTAAFTYDTELVTSVLDAGGYTAYRGNITSLTMQSGLHTVSNDPGMPTEVEVIDNQSGRDALAGLAVALLDGSPTYLGYHVHDVFLAFQDVDGSVLSDETLPTHVCLAEWWRMHVTVRFFKDGIVHFLYGSGVPDRSVDSDGDGLSDGVELLHACIDACAGNTDADGDTLLDSVEISATGTDPCSADTDGDGLDDAVDPRPLDPALSSDELAGMVRAQAASVRDIPEAAFDGPNANAQRGKRNALANRLQAAANELEAGNLEQALQILVNIRKWLDGDPSPPDVMEDGPAKDTLLAEIEALIALVEAAG